MVIVSCSEDKSENGKVSPNSLKTIDSVKNEPVAEKVIAPLPVPDTTALQLVEQIIAHPNGDTFSLFLPEGFAIRPVV
ncbi:MAG: hypothetical protein K2X86_08935 [Cytophagaceae bacterium]|nr:hypothetical protein [Cytophagaceae bacterium]